MTLQPLKRQPPFYIVAVDASYDLNPDKQKQSF